MAAVSRIVLRMATDFRIPDALKGLGSPSEVHPPKALSGRTGYWIVASVLLILCGVTVLGIVHPPQQNPPPPVVFFALTGVFGVLSMVFFGLGMFSQSYTLILFPEALARIAAGAPEIFRWSDVRDVYTNINPVAAKCRLITQDGRKLQIDAGVKGGKELGQTVQQALFDHMLPPALEAFGRGQTLTFGPLRIDQNSLYYKDKHLPWYDVAKMQLLYNPHTRSVHFEVNVAGSLLLPWCSVKIQDVPNVDVFKALAERKKAFTQ